MTRLIDTDTKKYPIVHCKRCGHSEQAHFNQRTIDRMVSNEWCFTCMCWEERTERSAAAQDDLLKGLWPSAVVVREDSGPRVYSVANELPRSRGLGRGYGGHKYIIEFDDGRRMCSSNLWSGEVVPELRRNDPAFKPMGRMLSYKEININEEFQRLFDAKCYYNGE